MKNNIRLKFKEDTANIFLFIHYPFSQSNKQRGGEKRNMKIEMKMTTDNITKIGYVIAGFFLNLIGFLILTIYIPSISEPIHHTMHPIPVEGWTLIFTGIAVALIGYGVITLLKAMNKRVEQIMP